MVDMRDAEQRPQSARASAVLKCVAGAISSPRANRERQLWRSTARGINCGTSGPFYSVGIFPHNFRIPRGKLVLPRFCVEMCWDGSEEFASMLETLTPLPSTALSLDIPAKLYQAGAKITVGSKPSAFTTATASGSSQ
jgi:hypothetical protein